MHTYYRQAVTVTALLGAVIAFQFFVLGNL